MDDTPWLPLGGAVGGTEGLEAVGRVTPMEMLEKEVGGEEEAQASRTSGVLEFV